MSDIKKVVLAYSGGLDTSVILKWLQETYQCEVVTFTADLGQGDELEPAREKAKAAGVKEIFIEDLKEEFVRDFVFPMFRANTIYEGELAGTAARGATPEQDQAAEAALLADPKERAEHVMLIDLARNDVGRIAQVGSVKVSEAFAVERYSHVMHIVSHVEGQLREGLSNMDVLRACFPAGTLSGAPKVHAMEWIDRLAVRGS